MMRCVSLRMIVPLAATIFGGASCAAQAAVRAEACESPQPLASFHLERVQAASADSVLGQGLLGFAAGIDQGLVLLTGRGAGSEGRALWVIDSLGRPAAIPVPDSVWWNFPEVGAVAATSEQVLLWEGPTGTVVMLGWDGQLGWTRRMVNSAAFAPRVSATGGLAVALSDDLDARQILHVATPIASSAIDTVLLPSSSQGRKFASVRTKSMTVNQRVPFYPEPVWGLLPDGGIGWSDGARHVVRRVTAEEPAAVPEVVICDRGDSLAPVSEAERQENEAVITWRNRYTDSTWSYVGPRVPAVNAAIVAVGSDRTGRILLTIPTASRRLTPAEVWSDPADTTAPMRHFALHWDVEMYDADGAPLGRFSLPPDVDYRLWTIDGETVWALREEPWSASFELVRYRLVADGS